MKTRLMILTVLVLSLHNCTAHYSVTYGTPRPQWAQEFLNTLKAPNVISGPNNLIVFDYDMQNGIVLEYFEGYSKTYQILASSIPDSIDAGEYVHNEQMGRWLYVLKLHRLYEPDKEKLSLKQYENL